MKKSIIFFAFGMVITYFLVGVFQCDWTKEKLGEGRNLEVENLGFNSIEFKHGFHITQDIVDTLQYYVDNNPEPPGKCHMELVEIDPSTYSIRCEGVCSPGKGCRLLHEEITSDKVLRVYCECEDKVKH